MPLKFLSPKSALWALDFGEHSVIALAAQKKASGGWEILGEGRARALGRSGGVITRLSDAAESVTEALRMAESQAGARCRRLYFNFDDAHIQSAHPAGSKALAGDGQITREDVRDAARSAARVMGDFEYTPVYTRETDYLIDGKDSVGDPVGVFGHRLDVTLHVVLAAARTMEQWKNVMRRAQIEKAWPILTLDSVCHAVVENAALPRVVWDLGEDFISGGVFERGALREYRVFSGLEAKEAVSKIAETSAPWKKRFNIDAPMLLTGDHAEKWAGKFEPEGLAAAPAGAKNVPGFQEPRYAAVAGLLAAATQREKRTAYVKAGGLWAGRVRERANALIQEYF